MYFNMYKENSLKSCIICDENITKTTIASMIFLHFIVYACIYFIGSDVL